MDVIKRNICIGDLIARMGSKIPSYDSGNIIWPSASGYTDWGRIPLDLIISSLLRGVETISFSAIKNSDSSRYPELRNLYDTLPLMVLDDNTASTTMYILKYKVMSDRFAMLKEVMRKARYYRPCMRGSEKKWVEITREYWENELHVKYDNDDGTENINLNRDKFFNQDWMMSSTIPSVEIIDGNASKFVCVYANMDEFVAVFRKNDNVRYEELFYNLVTALIENAYNEGEISYYYPHISLPICLTQDMNNIGEYDPYIQEWIPNKRFYVGELVHFVIDEENDPLGNTYKLERGDAFEEIEIPYAVYYSNSGDSVNYYPRDGKYYYKKYYYKGYYDTFTKLTYFDEINPDRTIKVNESGNTEHWTKCVASDAEPVSDAISAITESYIGSMQRKKRSYDDLGVELPFVLDNSGTNNTELNYLLGPCNLEIEENYKVCDVLSAIRFFQSGSTEAYSYVYNGQSLDPIKALDQARPLNIEFIEFEYYDNCKVDGDDILYDTGVFHYEVYHFNLGTYVAPVNDANTSFVWALTGATPNEEVEKLPDPSKTRYGLVYKYIGNTTYEIKGECVAVNSSWNTPIYGDTVLSGTSKQVYEILSYDDSGNPTYGWNEYACAEGDAYQMVRIVIDPATSTRTKQNVDIYMLSGNTGWVNITQRYGASSKLMAYNPSTNKSEPIQNGQCYTLNPEFAYIDINYDETYHWDNDKQTFESDGAVISRITYQGDNTLHDEFQDIDRNYIFVNENKGKSVDINMDLSLEIERGSAAAYERHLVLGEMNTFQDLINYKNNLFAL